MDPREVARFFNDILGGNCLIGRDFDMNIRDEHGVYAEIPIPYCFGKLFTCKKVVRMARILQNGPKIYVYKTPIHTRLEHSKGTYYRTLVLLVNLYNNDEKVKEYIVRNNYKKYLVALLIRAALHDLGHGPFSHTIEVVCGQPKGFHEDIGRRLIEEDDEIRTCLDNIIPNAAELIKESIDMDFLGLNRLFEGQIDVDRGDFLPRDFAHFYDESEARSIMEITTKLFSSIRMHISESVDGRVTFIPTFPLEQLLNINSFLDNRFSIYRDVFYNPQVVAYDILFKEFAIVLLESNEDNRLREFLSKSFGKEPNEIDLDEYTNFNDVEFFKCLFEIAKNTKNEKLRTYAALLLPVPDMLEGLFYGLLISTEQVDADGFRKENPSDNEFVADLETFFEPESLLNKLRTSFPFDSNVLIYNSNIPDQVLPVKEEILKVLGLPESELESYGVYVTTNKVTRYKNKPNEEIYIEDQNGNLIKYSDLQDGENFSTERMSIVILIPKLREKGIDEEVISSLARLIESHNKALSNNHRFEPISAGGNS